MSSVSGSRLLVGVLLAAGVALGGWLALAPREPQSAAPRSTSEPQSAAPRGTSELAAPSAIVPAAATPSASAPLAGLPPYTGPARDRERADRLRDALTTLLAGKLAAAGESDQAPATPSAAASAATGEEEHAPMLDDYIQKVMEEHFAPLVSGCYEALLQRRPKLAGNVVLQLSILGDRTLGGVVVDAALGSGTTLEDKAFETCVTEALYAVIFDAPPAGHATVSVKQALELEP